ncbi:hypothetical protein WICPIJ_004929 [Wickerhamomyces pijperi]|uniref:Uncharacterized protein n=1 Tax=Wickerhamomyces pijperi TaxID=599730 RepID=A0A9P8Q6P1_WICPI|nr:hypothetical protein WICPIJ_004929 [Wickerhamomyces pijperi]
MLRHCKRNWHISDFKINTFFTQSQFEAISELIQIVQIGLVFLVQHLSIHLSVSPHNVELTNFAFCGMINDFQGEVSVGHSVML